MRFITQQGGGNNFFGCPLLRYGQLIIIQDNPQRIIFDNVLQNRHNGMQVREKSSRPNP